jgi:hypothetical protein
MKAVVIVLSLMLQADASLPTWNAQHAAARLLESHNGTSASSNNSSNNCGQAPSSVPTGLSSACVAGFLLTSGNAPSCNTDFVQCDKTMTPVVTCTGEQAVCDTYVQAFTEGFSSGGGQECVHKDCDNAADLTAYMTTIRAAYDHSACMDGSNTQSPMAGVSLSIAVGFKIQCPTASGTVAASTASPTPPAATASGADSNVLPLVSLALLLCAWADL